MSCIIRSGTVGVLLVSGLLAGAILGGGSAYAQNDIAGAWSGRLHEDLHHRRPGPELGDYTGIPVNDASRLKADSWVASILTLREHQAKPHPSTYSLRGPASISIRRIVHPVTQDLVAYELFGTFGQATRLIWMDGRPHPPAHAPHAWAGFSKSELTNDNQYYAVDWYWQAPKEYLTGGYHH